MRSIIVKSVCLFFISFSSFVLHAQTDSLDTYVNRLKQSKTAGGSETAFMSIGSDFLYAQEYFEAGNYSAAAYSFEGVLRKDKDHPYANYQLGIALLKQKDAAKISYAENLLAHAFQLQPSLKEKFEKENGKQLATTVQTNPPVQTNTPVQTNAPVKTNTPVQTTNPVPTNAPAQTPSPVVLTGAVGLPKYIEQIKHSRTTGGASTAMLTPGLDAFYGIEYYEAGEYRLAEANFSLSLAKDPSNAYVNYMKAVSLAAIGKSVEAKTFLGKAVAGDASLQQRFSADTAAAKKRWKQKEDAKIIKPATPDSPGKVGGKIHYGDYTCHVSEWNGPNASPAFRQVYKGYFALKNNGTYRWLDNGGMGNFKYNSVTGEVSWLSGFLNNSKPKSSRFKIQGSYAIITIDMADNYQWECGCKL